MTEAGDEAAERSAGDPEHRAREAAFQAWRGGASPAPAEPEEELTLPRPRAALPPSFLFIVAAGCALLAAEPTVGLGYTLFGATHAVDLGRPAAYRLDLARDDIRARIAGYASNVRGSFARWGEDYEVVPLIGTPVLVRRRPHPAASADSAEPFEGEGRLLRLDDEGSSFLERLLNPVERPASQYANVRLEFVARGQLPFHDPAWLLLDGDLPRQNVWAIAKPLLLWAAAIACAIFGWRSQRARAAAARARSSRRLRSVS